MACSVKQDESARLYGYSPEHIPEIWPAVEGFIDSTLLDNGHVTLENVYENLLNKTFQLWTPYTDKIDAAVVTTIYNVRGRKNCTIISCGGTNMKDWIHLISLIEDWARDNDCVQLKVYGRRGWARVLGMKVISTEMSKTL